MVEASAVSTTGRISPDDSGIWSDRHAEAFKPIASFIRDAGAIPAIQLAHAGRKASTAAPWLGGQPLPSTDPRSWRAIAPSPIPFQQDWPEPIEMTASDLETVRREFEIAAQRSLKAGFQVVEIHMAHGYLLHEFLSPLSNHRTDAFGGAFENRTRFPLEVAKIVRAVWPESRPVFVRISATDWIEGGWDLDQSVVFAAALRKAGIDLIDCSSGALAPQAKIPAAPSYQVPFAERIRKDAGIATAAVGLITESRQAEEIIQLGRADAVFLARAMLRDPYWPLHASQELGADVEWPKQYARAKP